MMPMLYEQLLTGTEIKPLDDSIYSGRSSVAHSGILRKLDKIIRVVYPTVTLRVVLQNGRQCRLLWLWVEFE